MQEPIRVWLSERGMAQYADAFAAQNVDLAVLPNLTDQDLKDLGVLLGDRRKILAWAEGPESGQHVIENVDGTLAPHPSKEAERRQVTVLFSRSRGFDRTVAQARSGGHARSHPCLSGRGYQGRAKV